MVFTRILFRGSRASVAVSETVHETGQNQMGIGKLTTLESFLKGIADSRRVR